MAHQILPHPIDFIFFVSSPLLLFLDFFWGSLFPSLFPPSILPETDSGAQTVTATGLCCCCFGLFEGVDHLSLSLSLSLSLFLSLSVSLCVSVCLSLSSPFLPPPSLSEWWLIVVGFDSRVTGFTDCLNRKCNVFGLLPDFPCCICICTEFVDLTTVQFQISPPTTPPSRQQRSEIPAEALHC